MLHQNAIYENELALSFKWNENTTGTITVKKFMSRKAISLQAGAVAFTEIFKRNPQHSKAFTILFINVFVMNFVRSSYGFKISIVRISKKFKTLVNKNIMH